MIKIASFAGGACRGALIAQELVQLEAATGKRTAELFDFLAGTSTGSIVAASCVTPKKLSAQDILGFYTEYAPTIFHGDLINVVENLWSAKYGNAMLLQSLQAVLGPYTLAEATIPLLIPASNLKTYQGTLFKSYTPDWTSLPLWAACAASSSAQTFFPAFEYSGNTWIDGGNFANQPSDIALDEATLKWPGEDILVVAFGTGTQPAPPVIPVDGGLLNWAAPLFNFLCLLSEWKADEHCRHAPPNVTYISVNPTLAAFPAMDDASPATIQFYVDAANAFIADNPKTWNTLLEQLAL